MPSRLGDIRLGDWNALGWSGAAVAARFDQHSFRIRNDDGNETTATWAAALNTDWQPPAVATNFRVRFCIDNSQGGQSGAFTPQLQYSKNSGAWTTVDGASSVIRSYASGNLADNAATTEQLAGPATFVAGAFDEADGALAAITLATTEETEVEFCVRVQIADVVTGDTIGLRVSDAGAALYSYTQTPTLTVSLAEARIAQLPSTVWYLPDTQEARVAQIVSTVWFQEVLLPTWEPPGHAKPPKVDPPGNKPPKENQRDIREYRWRYLRSDAQGRYLAESSTFDVMEAPQVPAAGGFTLIGPSCLVAGGVLVGPSALVSA